MVTYESAMGLLGNLASLDVEGGFYTRFLNRLQSERLWDAKFRAYLADKRFATHLQMMTGLLFDFPNP